MRNALYWTTADGLLGLGHRVDIVLLRPGIWYHQEIPAAARLVLSESAADALEAEEESRLPASVCRWHVGRAGKALLERRRPSVAGAQLAPTVIAQCRYVQEHAVRRRLRQERNSLIAFFRLCPMANVVATLLAKFLLGSFPVVIPVVHNVLENRRLRDRVRYSILMPHSDQIVAVSEGVQSQRFLQGRRSQGADNHYLQPCRDSEAGGTEPRGPPPPLAGRERATHHPFRRQVRTRVKDFPTLIRAFQKLSAVSPARLILLGDGSQRKDMTALVRRLNLEDRVSMPGWVDNPYAFMARASLFATSSRMEGLQNVLIEALACGCPCVSTDCPSGPAEILEGGRIGRLVPIADVEALAEAMRLTIEDPPPRTLLLKRADHFSAENSVAMYERLITETVRDHCDGAKLVHKR